MGARTSSFSFKELPDIATVAQEPNVGTVLEGSVRRSANTVRITVQLINAVTGFHLWSKTYDRNLGEVLQLQTEIATAVADALKLTLLADIAAKVELGGTRDPAAFDAYLRGEKARSSILDLKNYPAAIAAYTEAIRLDRHYALTFAARSIVVSDYTAGAAETEASMREGLSASLRLTVAGYLLVPAQYRWLNSRVRWSRYSTRWPVAAKTLAIHLCRGCCRVSLIFRDQMEQPWFHSGWQRTVQM
jgi:hypothetical protein